jgi:hypothetical protein
MLGHPQTGQRKTKGLALETKQAMIVNTRHGISLPVVHIVPY